MDLSPAYRYFSSSVRIHSGAGALDRLADEVQRRAVQRAFVVCGGSARRSGLLERLRATLGEAFAGAFEGVQTESPLPSVEAGVEAARAAGADAIVPAGGGSAVVTARAITILLAEQGTAHDLCTQYPPGRTPISPRVLQPKLPNFVVLTTPTTAANRAGAAVMDPVRRHRLELFDPKTRPAAVILDADALLTAPSDLYLSTATTTFTGAVGALQSRGLNPLSFADLRTALDLSRRFMPELRRRPDDPDIRLHLATAALLANRASDASGGYGGQGVTSALGHQLQTHYDGIHQGDASAALTVPGMRFNSEVLAPEQARLAVALGAAKPGMPDREAAEAAAIAVSEMLASIGKDRRLRDLGVPESDLETLANEAMDDFFLRGNARPVTAPAELLSVLREAW